MRRGAEPFERVLELARVIRCHFSQTMLDLSRVKMAMYRYVMHHSRKEKDMR